MADPSRYQSGGGHVQSHRGDYDLTDYDETSADIPIWNWLSGAGARRDARDRYREADINRDYWNQLHAPSASELAVDYDQAQYDPEGHDAQARALSQLEQWGRGGLTGADRRMMEQTRGRDMQASRAQQQALSQAAYARGMGSSGLDFATQQQASQMGQQQASDAESQMMASAQQRALAATQAQSQLGTAMRGQMEHETEYNTGVQHSQEDANRDAVQTAYQDAANRAAGATGQYSTDASARQSDLNRRDQETSDTLGGIGSLLAAL